ncbi:hypothetical protein V6K52_09145 [Knoellia sp. S7-12]|uniref:hypothetical protein n=1 Tax=Knoellia sp. S7-12 TaxID=3126698 RepID=UPI0033670CBC
MTLPDLDQPLAYPHDTSDHPGGGHCLDLTAYGDAERWRQILDQQFLAFAQLVERARTPSEASNAGYEVTRPLLFLAHHVCEVAIKVGLATHHAEPRHREHSLPTLWTRLEGARGTDRLSRFEESWCERFVVQMHAIKPRGFDGRYADETTAEEAWCCLHLDQLEACVTVFASLMVKS